MIIGFDGSRAFTTNRTGTENYSYQLLKNLAFIDHQNSYVVFLRPGNFVKKEEWPENFQFQTLNFRFLWTQVGLSLETFKQKLDLLFVTAHTLPLIHRPGLKTLMVVHDLGAEFLPKAHQLKQRLYLDFITKFQLQNATKLIAVSQSTKKDLVSKARVRAPKIEVIYEGIDIDHFKSLYSDVVVDTLNKFDCKKGKYFLFVGSIQPRKNLARLIEAFALLVARIENPESRKTTDHSRLDSSNLRLVLVGSKGWLSDDIYILPDKLGIPGRVKFLGWVDDQDLPALYQGAIALTFPSLFEGFGLPILEAFASNCPVLTSNTSSMPEVVGKAAILVDPYDIKDIATGLQLISQDKVRQKLIADGHNQLKNFSWQKCAQETLDLINRLA